MEENCPFSKKPCDKEKNIHIIQDCNGEIKEWNCCNECGMSNVTGFMAVPLSILQHLLSNNINKLEIIGEIYCESCKSTLYDIQKTGRFGCSKCYETFKEDIQELLPQIHLGGKIHVGKKPKYNIELLKNEMAKAVKEERYEDAAKFRDLIKNFQGNNVETPK